MGNRKIFGVTAALLSVVFISAGMRAQTLPTDILTSPQSETTQGRYRSMADDFIRTDTYSSVKFNTFYAYTSFASTLRASAGFATKFNDIYLAAYYGGNFWSGLTTFTHTNRTLPFNSNSKTFPTYDGDPDFTGTIPDNRVALLIGFANMGIRLTYASNHEFFNKNDIAVQKTEPDPANPGSDIVTNTFYKNYKTGSGFISPQIEWAMSKDIAGKSGIRPKAGINMNLYRDYVRYQTYNSTDGSSNGEVIGESSNFLYPHFYFVLNGYHFYYKNSFRLTADLDYDLYLRFCNNEYTYTDGGKIKTGTISGFNSGSGFFEKSYIQNLITPSLAGQWSNNKLALKFKLNMVLRITGEETTPMALSAVDTGKLIRHGTDTKTGIFGFEPNLRLACQWKIVPDRFTMNLGARLNLGNITSTTVDKNEYVNGKKNDNNKAVTGGFGSTGYNLGLGFTLAATENLAFEAGCGLSQNKISVFDPAGLLSFANILVSLKF